MTRPNRSKTYMQLWTELIVIKRIVSISHNKQEALWWCEWCHTVDTDALDLSRVGMTDARMEHLTWNDPLGIIALGFPVLSLWALYDYLIVADCGQGRVEQMGLLDCLNAWSIWTMPVESRIFSSEKYPSLCKSVECESLSLIVGQPVGWLCPHCLP